MAHMKLNDLNQTLAKPVRASYGCRTSETCFVKLCI